jgi:hypothetical protein
MALQAERLLDKFEDMERAVERDLRRAQRRLNASRARDAHPSYGDFAPYGDARAYKRRLPALRRALKK